jgi:hypothetical protein
MKTKEQELLDSARRIALTAPTWSDLSNALFNQADGILAMAYPTREERERFIRSPEYKAIQELIDAARERSGWVEGATPTQREESVATLNGYDGDDAEWSTLEQQTFTSAEFERIAAHLKSSGKASA